MTFFTTILNRVACNSSGCNKWMFTNVQECCNLLNRIYVLRNDEKARSNLLFGVCKKVGKKFTEFLRKLGVEEHIINEYLEHGEKSFEKKLVVLRRSTEGRSSPCLVYYVAFLKTTAPANLLLKPSSIDFPLAIWIFSSIVLWCRD